ncbi:geranylgeranyl pyrophosphate synthase [Clostridia bacterium]|nr:geranylgeranyl pyrophosphate synthase [Clostridia bacterium]
MPIDSINKIDIERHLKSRLKNGANQYPQQIFDAMHYSLTAGGKRLRPRLMLNTFGTFAKDKIYLNTCIDFAVALEMIHTYSLIHDDLPCMDDDDLRRGLPTAHIKFGEGMAVLAGDALLNRAYEVIANASVEKPFMPVAKAAQVVSRNAGVYGMVGGQVLDILSNTSNDDKKLLRDIHRMKTGALFAAAIGAGAYLAELPDKKCLELINFAENMGILFQMKDDIIDVTATAEEIGKPPKSDAKNGKLTYVALYGLEGAEEEYMRARFEFLTKAGEIIPNESELYQIIQKIVD